MTTRYKPWKVSARGGADESARRILAGIDDGDPEILDTLPTPDLSGQWAGDLSGAQVFADIVADANEPILAIDPAYADDRFTDVLDTYEQAFRDAAQDKIAALARYALGIAYPDSPYPDERGQVTQ